MRAAMHRRVGDIRCLFGVDGFDGKRLHGRLDTGG